MPTPRGPAAPAVSVASVDRRAPGVGGPCGSACPRCRWPPWTRVTAVFVAPVDSPAPDTRSPREPACPRWPWPPSPAMSRMSALWGAVCGRGPGSPMMIAAKAGGGAVDRPV